MPAPRSTSSSWTEPDERSARRRRPRSTAARTPLHLAFSCHVVDDGGRVLLTRGRPRKRHLARRVDERLLRPPAARRDPARRRGASAARGARPRRRAAWRWRCPTSPTERRWTTARSSTSAARSSSPRSRASRARTPSEVDDLRWQPWTDLVERVRRRPERASARGRSTQVARARRAGAVAGRLARPATHAERGQALLDRTDRRSGGRSIRRWPPDRRRGRRPGRGGPAGRTSCSPGSSPPERWPSTAIDPALAELTDEIRALVAAGGKRLRPAFVHWGHRATGAEPDEAVLHPAAAVELLHTFALLHDDVMDRSATRRGRPTAHAALADRHRARGAERRRRTGSATSAADPRRRPRLRVGRRAARPHAARRRRRRTGPGRVHDAPRGGDRRPAPRPPPRRRSARPTSRGRRDVALLKSARYTSPGRCSSAPRWRRPPTAQRGGAGA